MSIGMAKSKKIIDNLFHVCATGLTNFNMMNCGGLTVMHL